MSFMELVRKQAIANIIPLDFNLFLGQGEKRRGEVRIEEEREE